jgi:hypothetical protein
MRDKFQDGTQSEKAKRQQEKAAKMVEIIRPSSPY